MDIIDYEARQVAWDRLEQAARANEEAKSLGVVAWENLKRAGISLCIDHGVSIERCAKLAGVHRATMTQWVKFERALRANYGEATRVPAD